MNTGTNNTNLRRIMLFTGANVFLAWQPFQGLPLLLDNDQQRWLLFINIDSIQEPTFVLWGDAMLRRRVTRHLIFALTRTALLAVLLGYGSVDSGNAIIAAGIDLVWKGDANAMVPIMGGNGTSQSGLVAQASGRIFVSRGDGLIYRMQ